MKTIVDIVRSYAEKNDLKENKARKQYEMMFNYYCREAEKVKRDLWEYLSTEFMILEEKHLIKPPDRLKNKKNRRDWIKKEFWPFHLEWMFNHVYAATTKELNLFLLGKKKGGDDRGEKIKKRSNARKARIKEKENELITSGRFIPGKERGRNKIIARELGETYDYVQNTRKEEKDKNGSS